MTELDFIEQWEADKPAYSAWGDAIVEEIKAQIAAADQDPQYFFKVPPIARLKENQSLVDKAFNRNKKYDDPYNDIEDKVGARFIVLLIDHIKKIQTIIETSDKWTFDACKHFDIEKMENPLLFTYQSVHYILKPKNDTIIAGVNVSKNIPCELQIRTLLQHAHAELTHDAIYKSKNRTIQPEVHRTVAKSMALIETTDGFFTEVTEKLNNGPLEELNIIGRLDGVYLSKTDLVSLNQKSALIIWDEFQDLIDENLIDSIMKLVEGNLAIIQCIKQRYGESTFYQQSTILFVYWLLKKKKNRVISDWPISRDLLQLAANDLGISLAR
jgi:ppGpp synthetase/RelA/SpoT-type nucleotidyltranferase